MFGGSEYLPMTQKEMVQLLKKHGWTKTSGGKGSHVKMSKPQNSPIIIPHGELNKYTELGIKKAINIK